MRKPLTQIPLDFGGNNEASSPKADGNPGQHDAQYLASAGVGVRVKAFKKPAASPDSDLFQAPTEEPTNPLPAPPNLISMVAEPVSISTEPVPISGDPISISAEPVSISGDPISISADEVLTVEVPVEVQPAPARVLREARPTKSPTKTGPSKRGRKSLKQVAAEADLIEVPSDEVLFRKQYYTMGEVSEMFKVNQSLLRYWETEFDILQPRKNKKGDRYFRPVDIKNLHLIYHLLRQKKYTIEGAKEFLRNNKKAKERFEVIERLQQIRNFLLEWKAQL